jgi:hypothetical protein
MLFSPERCERVSPPAKRSEVRPCDRTVARLTPGILDVEAEPPGNPVLSSSSESVSGYGEKYLQRDASEREFIMKHATHQVLIRHCPKLTLSKFLCAVICLWCLMSNSSSVMRGSGCMSGSVGVGEGESLLLLREDSLAGLRLAPGIHSSKRLSNPS